MGDSLEPPISKNVQKKPRVSRLGFKLTVLLYIKNEREAHLTKARGNTA